MRFEDQFHESLEEFLRRGGFLELESRGTGREIRIRGELNGIGSVMRLRHDNESLGRELVIFLRRLLAEDHKHNDFRDCLAYSAQMGAMMNGVVYPPSRLPPLERAQMAAAEARLSEQVAAIKAMPPSPSFETFARSLLSEIAEGLGIPASAADEPDRLTREERELLRAARRECGCYNDGPCICPPSSPGEIKMLPPGMEVAPAVSTPDEAIPVRLEFKPLCPECRGTRKYQPLIGPAEPCRACCGG